ncbi:MAG: tRNA lysidine(34) synthetase TilS [Pseudomonadota bacterium]
MTFSPQTLSAQLASLNAKAGPPSRFIVAFSGGLDSTVLLHALVQLRLETEVVAIHIDHGLQESSADWEHHCRQVAGSLGVEFRSVKVRVQLESGKGPEASAREARYSGLLAEMQADDWLLSAHHREDQAETLLLNLIRGSGPAGVAGIGDIRRFGPGWLARPLLNVDRQALHDYATHCGLRWIEDPTNKDRNFDRNFLRHEVLPRLKMRWPDIAARLQRSAGHAGEASQLLVDLARIDLDALGGEPGRLPIDRLSSLSPERQRNVIRHSLRELGLSTPTALQLDRVMQDLIPAREDAQPLVSWPGTSVRRYRNGLYLMPQDLADVFDEIPVEAGRAELGSGLGTLAFEDGAQAGLDPVLLDHGLTVRRREGGEEFQPAGQQHTRKLKKLLQEEGVVPWMRNRLPLVYCGERLVAVGDLWMVADATANPGVQVRWRARPALH